MDISPVDGLKDLRTGKMSSSCSPFIPTAYDQ